MSKAECGEFVIHSCPLEREEQGKACPRSARELCHSWGDLQRDGVDLDHPMNETLGHPESRRVWGMFGGIL